MFPQLCVGQASGVTVCELVSWLVDQNLEKALHRWQPRLVPRDAYDAVVDISAETRDKGSLPDAVGDESGEYAGEMGTSCAGPWVGEDRGAIVAEVRCTLMHMRCVYVTMSGLPG